MSEIEQVEQALGTTHTQLEVDTASLYAASKADLNMLAAVCMPHMFKYMFPTVFIGMWTWLTPFLDMERAFPRLVLGLPRGFAKTVVIKLFILYCIFFTRKQYIVVFCATEEKAEGILADIKQILSSDNVKSIFGDWETKKETDRVNLKKFWFKGRPVVLRAAGTGTDIRGTNLFEARPDVQIFDDVQKREDAESEVEAKKLRTWFYDTALKTRSPEGCMYIFLGNMYPTEHSLLRELCNNADWLKFVTGCILANGESLWEDLVPIDQLLKEYEMDKNAGRLSSFLAEMMNDESVSAISALDVTKVPQNKFEGEILHQGNCIIIDPSTGKVGKDAVAVGYVEIYDAIPVFKKVIQGALSPGDTIRTALTMALENNCMTIFVEAVAYQETLLYWFGVITEQLGITGITFEPIYPGRASKNARIIDMFPALLKGEVMLGNDVRALTISQAQRFQPSKTKNTDELLDILCYCLVIAAKYGEFLASQAILGRQFMQEVPILGHEQTCSF